MSRKKAVEDDLEHLAKIIVSCIREADRPLLMQNPSSRKKCIMPWTRRSGRPRS